MYPNPKQQARLAVVMLLTSFLVLCDCGLYKGVTTTEPIRPGRMRVSHRRRIGPLHRTVVICGTWPSGFV